MKKGIDELDKDIVDLLKDCEGGQSLHDGAYAALLLLKAYARDKKLIK